MRIKISQTMVKFIKNTLPKDHDVKLVKLTPKEYGWQVHYDGEYHAEQYGDYDYKTGLCKAIKILYPADYYAMPNYITTKDLKDYYKEAKEQGEVSQKSYEQAILNNLLI